MKPGEILRAVVCWRLGHDPFPSNPTVRRSRCWRCGRMVPVVARPRRSLK